ncbi:MAG: hypothetical protein HZT43_15250 [Exiguobacterium profundum]|nr:MAG: hypothetical protein HZT43_15250 [Exiguobacterium profundum]
MDRAGQAAVPATEPASAAELQTGSLFRNVMHDCYLSITTMAKFPATWLRPQARGGSCRAADDGKYSSFYNLKHSCALAMGRDGADSDQLSCYFNGDEQQAAFEFSINPVGGVFNLVNARRDCGVYETRLRLSHACRLRVRATSNGR